MRYLILFLFASSLFVSCGSESTNSNTAVATTKSKASAAAAKTNANARKAQNVNAYWLFMQKETGISQAQLTRIKQINLKYSTKTQSLIKQKKWRGPANAKTRNGLTTNKNKEINKVLGAKWKKWAASHKKWTAS